MASGKLHLSRELYSLLSVVYLSVERRGDTRRDPEFTNRHKLKIKLLDSIRVVIILPISIPKSSSTFSS